MSSSEAPKAEGGDRQALQRLEGAVGRLLAEVVQLRSRSRKAEARVRDVEALLRRFTKGEDDPVRLQDRLTALTEENSELRGRMNEGREGVERLLSRVRFLEEQK